MANVIVKTSYTRNIQHVNHYLTYSGQKLEAQVIVFADGSEQNVSPDMPVRFDGSKKKISSIKVRMKSGRELDLSEFEYSVLIAHQMEEQFTSELTVTQDVLTYGGETIEAQSIVFDDGTFRAVDPKEKIDAAVCHKPVSGISLRTRAGPVSLTVEEYEQLVILERSERQFSPDGYAKYMAERPGTVQDEERNGLFNLSGSVKTEDALETIRQYDGHTWWMQIISVTREEGERTGYDTRKAWEDVVKSKIPGIAKAYNISMDHLVFYAAYHDKEQNPHVHLCYTSTDRNEGFLYGGAEAMKASSRELRSMFTNHIFKDDMEVLKTRSTKVRKELKYIVQQRMKQVIDKKYRIHPEIARQFDKLVNDLKGHTGRKAYRSLPAATKETINKLLWDLLDKDTVIRKTFLELTDVQKGFLSAYEDDEIKIERDLSAFREKVLHADQHTALRGDLHNMILKYAFAFVKQQDGDVYGQNAFPDVPEAAQPAVQKKADTLTGYPNAVNMESVDFSAPPPAEEWKPDAADLEFLSDLPETGEPAVQKKRKTLTASGPLVKADPADRLMNDTLSGKKGAEYKLAKSLLEGKNGCIMDKDEAVTLFETLYSRDQDAFAAYQLGKHYASQREKIPFHRNLALEYFHASAEHLPYTLRENMMPHIAKQIHRLEYQEAIDILLGRNGYAGNPSTAEIHLLRIARSGDAAANFVLGRIYKDGSQDIQQDLKKAVEHFSLARDEYIQRDDLCSFMMADYCNSIYRDSHAEGLAVKLAEGSDIPAEAYQKVIQEHQGSLLVSPERIMALAQKHLDDDKNAGPLLSYLSTNTEIREKLASAPDYDENAKKALAVLAGIQEGNGYYAAWSDSYRLAKSFLYGKDEIFQDIEAGKKYLAWEAGSGNALAMADLGRIYGASTDAGDLALSEEYYQQAMTAFRDVEQRDKKLRPYLQYRIGCLYEYGNGCEKDIIEAIRWYGSAAEKKNPSAHFALGNIYFYGDAEVSQDYSRARQHYAKSIEYAKEANPFAMYNLGTIYDMGLGTDPDSEKAKVLYQESYKLFSDSLEKQKDDRVYYRLGHMLHHGIGVEQDLFESVTMYAKASELNNAKAQYMLAKIYLDESSGLYAPERGLAYLQKSADRSYAQAQYLLGKYYLHQHKTAKGLELLRLAADQGNHFAQYTLGKVYLDTEKGDIHKALALLQQSAEQGNQFAQYELGKHLKQAGDNDQAAEFLKLSADQDNPYAAYALGKLYLDRTKWYASDTAEGVKYLEQVVNHSFDSGKSDLKNHARFLLARHFFSGEDKDVQKALNYLREAAAGEYGPAQKLLGRYQRYGTIEYQSKNTRYACKQILSGVVRIMGALMIKERDQQDHHGNNAHVFRHQPKFQQQSPYRTRPVYRNTGLQP